MSDRYDDKARSLCHYQACAEQKPCPSCEPIAQALREAHREWKVRAERLWQLLDDIDTLADAAKGHTAAYLRGIGRLHALRWKYADSDGYVLTWKPLEDTHEETAEETMARVICALAEQEPDDDN